MSDDWRQVDLGALGEFRNGVNFSREQEGSGLPVLKVKDFGEAFFVPSSGLDELDATAVRVPEGQYLEPGDVVIIRSNGNPSLVGRCLYFAGSERRITFSGFCIRFRPNPALIEPRFAAYVLRSPASRQRFYSFGSGTGIQNLSQSVLASLPVALPTRAEQRVITQLLGALDDKIELNRRMNQTLEAMAQALFRSWFVDFDLVRAKAEGQLPEGIDPEIAALFPSRFAQAPHGELPAGWSWLPLDHVAHFLNGLALQKFPPVDGESLPVIKIAQLRRGSTDDADQTSAGIPREYVVQDGDVLFSWSGSLLVSIWAGGRGALNQHLFKVTSDAYPKWFYLFWCREHLPEFQRIAQAKATTMGHIQRHHLTEALVAVPPQELLKTASHFFEPVLARWLANALESKTLLKLRDILLPKLLSGEILIRDADAQLAASG